MAPETGPSIPKAIDTTVDSGRQLQSGARSETKLLAKPPRMAVAKGEYLLSFPKSAAATTALRKPSFFFLPSAFSSSRRAASFQPGSDRRASYERPL